MIYSRCCFHLTRVDFVRVEQLLIVLGSWLSGFNPHAWNLQQRADNLWSLSVLLSSQTQWWDQDAHRGNNESRAPDFLSFSSPFMLFLPLSSYQCWGLCFCPSERTDYEIWGSEACEVNFQGCCQLLVSVWFFADCLIRCFVFSAVTNHEHRFSPACQFVNALDTACCRSCTQPVLPVCPVNLRCCTCFFK